MKNLEFRTRELFTDTEFLAKIDSQVQRRLHHPERKEVVLSPDFLMAPIRPDKEQ